MQIDILLKQLLRDYRLDKHGITKEISEDLGCHRHTIGKLYRNQLSNPSLQTLAGLCAWLQRHNVPGDILPQALFGARPSEFWKAVAAPGIVTFYLGEYRQTQPPAPARRWISLRDAAVMAKIIEVLSTSTNISTNQLSLQTRYVPFHFSAEKPEVEMQVFLKDARGAVAVFDKMKSQTLRGTSILVGSQRVNLLVEVMVADLFGCKAFQMPKTRPRVPFYQVYRKGDRPVPSCFGGAGKLPGRGGPAEPGLYYRDENDRWVACPWKENQRDAGIILTIYDPGTQILEIAVFGFSGRGTAAMGKAMEQCADSFWPPEVEANGKRVGVYLCKFELSEELAADPDEHVVAKKTKVISLDRDVLKKYLR